jgi:hypothetical protein
LFFFRADHAARARVAAEIFPMRRVGAQAREGRAAEKVKT